MDSSNEKVFALDDLMPLIQAQLANGNCVRFSPRGTSMLPMLQQGIDTVTLSPLPDKLHKYDLPLYQRDNGQYVLHRIIAVDSTYTCIGDNQFVFERGVRKNQMIALVTAFTHNGRTYQVTDFPYQLYCRFWHTSRPLRFFVLRVKNHIRRWLK